MSHNNISAGGQVFQRMNSNVSVLSGNGDRSLSARPKIFDRNESGVKSTRGGGAYGLTAENDR
jgi:hypothetical protein